MATAPTEIYTLSLHDALPIFGDDRVTLEVHLFEGGGDWYGKSVRVRSEEHTSELQSRGHLVCRLLLEKKNTYLNADDDTANSDAAPNPVRSTTVTRRRSLMLQ